MSECDHYWMRSRFYEEDSVCENCNMHMSELLGKAERERDELKAKVEELEVELRIDRAHRVNQNIIDLLDFADARPDLWEYLLYKNKDKVSKLLEVLK